MNSFQRRINQQRAADLAAGITKNGWDGGMVSRSDPCQRCNTHSRLTMQFKNAGDGWFCSDQCAYADPGSERRLIDARIAELQAEIGRWQARRDMLNLVEGTS